MEFAAFSLPEPLLTNLAGLGFSKATQVQAEAIPLVLAGSDLLVQAQTGTGKTAAFALPLLARLLPATTERAVKPAAPKALVLVPTRELAQQVFDNIKSYAKGCELKIAIAYGGVPLDGQLKNFKDGVDLLVATPGRLLDHLKKRSLRLDKVETLVFDEADRMLDMGFEDEISALMKKMAKQRQTLLFSATFNDNIWRLAKTLLKSPKVLELQASEQGGSIKERLIELDSERKAAAVAALCRRHDWRQVLLFSRTKEGADKLVCELSAEGLAASALHSDLSQAQREQTYQAFKAGECRLLVATDVAARGLDVAALPCVINLELPFKREDYVHRIGRTGRAGMEGLAITLFSRDDERLLEELEAMLDRRLPREWLPGFEPDLNRSFDAPRNQRKAAQKQRARKRALGKR
ncbi:DEAD/DEAH box helicase [Shewanella algae]|uniref:DEAD/DEAH box helicase n=1 Tax=Shewanella algae TaxID=38313 RepID=UPI00222FC92C|nr:DEAD/DEAH box helicase [Shewanella algae]UZD57173.1 DEAD/DEAH box helicase [Shewanella algae]